MCTNSTVCLLKETCIFISYSTHAMSPSQEEIIKAPVCDWRQHPAALPLFEICICVYVNFLKQYKLSLTGFHVLTEMYWEKLGGSRNQTADDNQLSNENTLSNGNEDEVPNSPAANPSKNKLNINDPVSSVMQWFDDYGWIIQSAGSCL